MADQGLDKPRERELSEQAQRELSERRERELLWLSERELRELLERKELRELLERREQPEQAPISLYFDLDSVRLRDIPDIIALLSELYADIGGDALVIDDVTLLDFQPASVPVEV